MNIKYDFSGQTAIVTGGARGIGRAIAAEFVRFGAQVWTWDDGNPTVVMEHNKITNELPAGWDINFDDHAIEVVDQQNGYRPMVQVIQDGDYSIWFNAVIVTGPRSVMVIKDDVLTTKPIRDVTENDFPSRLFRYPAYANRGRRD
jgi:NAD(P)-dependent dehydrogenase (short-subunit alcohol dehydrogenase family)